MEATAVPETPDPTPAPVEEAPVSAAETAPEDAAPSTPTDAAPTPASLTDDTVVEVIVDGQPVQMAWKDARRNISAHAASTQRFMAAAEERKQVEAIRQQVLAAHAAVQQREAQLQAIMSDDQKAAAFWMAVKSQQQGQSQGQPTQAPPDLNAFAQQMLQRTEQIVQERLAQVQQAEVAQRLSTELDDYTQSLIGDHPVFTTIPGFADTVMAEVYKMSPTSVPQAKEMIAGFIHEQKRLLDTKLANASKQVAVTKAKAVTATERGGSPITAAPKVPNVFGDDFERAILDHLNASEARG